MSLPTLADLKAQVNVSTTTDDDELQDMLDAAVDVVTGIVGPFADPAEVTETHYDVNSSVLVLRRMPVASLVSVSSRFGATTTPLTLADYELDAATGLVRVAWGGRFVGSFTVTYTAGRADTPAAIRLACLIVAEHLWQTQRGVTPSALALQDPNFADAVAGPVGLGYAIPSRAQELLAPYMRPSIA